MDIQDARLARLHVDHAGDLVIELVLFAAHRVHRDFNRLGPRRPAAEDQGLRLQLPALFKGDVLRHQHFSALAYGQLALAAGEAPTLQGDRGRQFGIRQGARRHDSVGDLDVLVGMLLAEADGVYGNALPPDGRDGRQVDTARVIRAIAQHDDRAQGQRRGFGQDPLQRFTEARGRGACRELVGFLNSLRLAAKFVKSHLEAIAETFEHPGIERGLRRRLARSGRIVDRHAARIVHQNRHHVLLGTQRRDTQRGVPEQKQDEGDQPAFQQPDGQRARSGEHAVIAAHVPEKRSGSGQNGNRQHPDRPRRQEDELALMEDAGRIFEQKFEHGSTSAAHSDKYRDVPGTGWRYKQIVIGGKVHRSEALASSKA